MALSLSFTNWVNHPNTPSVPGAADINRLQDNDRFFANLPAMKIRRTVEAAIPHATDTAIGFNVDEMDSEEGHDPVGNPTTMIVRETGWYDLRAHVMWGAPSGGAAPTGYRSLRINRTLADGSSTATVWRDDKPPVPTANTGTGHLCTGPLYLLYVNQRVKVHAVQTQGSTINISVADFSMIWMRQP